MDKHDDVDGLRRFLERRYVLPRHLPAKRMMPSDALDKLGSAIYGDAWLGCEVHLVEPDRDAGVFVNEAWQRRAKILQIMVELLEAEIARAFAYDQDDAFDSVLDPSTWRKQIGQIALDSGEIQIADGRRRIWPILLLIEQESFETALASLRLSRMVTDQDTEIAPHHKGEMSLPPQPTYSEVLKYIERQYVEEDFNFLMDRLVDALMIRKLVAWGYRRHRPANAGDRGLVLSKSLVPLDPLVWAQSKPQGIGQFLQDPAGDLNEGWLNVSLVRAEVMAWLNATVAENGNLQRLARSSNASTKQQNTIASVTECREWLVGMMFKNGQLQPKAKTKTEYRIEAQGIFGISERQFIRAWDDAIEATGASDWSDPGRLAKSV
jgi:hypothetical protein